MYNSSHQINIIAIDRRFKLFDNFKKIFSVLYDLDDKQN